MTRYITDGEIEWFLCDRLNCELKVVAKGVARCDRCDNWSKENPVEIADFNEPEVYPEGSNPLVERYRRMWGLS